MDKLLPVSEAGDFLVRRTDNDPLMLLTGRVRQPKNSTEKALELRLENVSSQSVQYAEYGVFVNCGEVMRNATIILGDKSGTLVKSKRKATLMAPKDRELDSLLDAMSLAACKARITLRYVEFKDGSCWRPNVEVNID